MTVETWPGPMNASSRRSGESRIALMAGTIVTWLQNTEKFSMPSARGSQHGHRRRRRGRLEADRQKTTCLSGFWRAIVSASSGE